MDPKKSYVSNVVFKKNYITQFYLKTETKHTRCSILSVNPLSKTSISIYQFNRKGRGNSSAPPSPFPPKNLSDLNYNKFLVKRLNFYDFRK